MGVYEAAAVAVCTFYGVPKEQALAAAITLHLLIFLPGLIGTLILLAQGRFRLADARHKALTADGAVK